MVTCGSSSNFELSAVRRRFSETVVAWSLIEWTIASFTWALVCRRLLRFTISVFCGSK